MPDLIGLPSVQAFGRLGKVEGSARLGLTSSWERPVAVRCGVRPGTVVRQHPAPGAPLHRGMMVRIRTAALDLKQFRGPCEPHGSGQTRGPGAELARKFYRFAADPTLGAPFSEGGVWTGIEQGPASTTVGKAERAKLAAWHVGTGYAESRGPFSALDILASSGGYYELHRGVAATCGFGNDRAPPELAGLRAISLTASPDVTDSCMDWWGVTLFLDNHDRIRGVALRLGSP